jgi:hypothetical protein
MKNELAGARPNGLPITRAALIDRESYLVKPAFKMAAILGPHSGVGCMGVLAGSFTLGGGSLDRYSSLHSIHTRFRFDHIGL